MQARQLVRGSRILLLGLAYKANVDDDRESPSYRLMDKLEELGALVSYNDPFVPVIKTKRDFPQFEGRLSVVVSSDYDLILIATAHEVYRSIDLASFGVPVVDTRHVITTVFNELYCA